MPRTPLSVGAYGGDVSRLQSALVQRGFQISASEVVRRFFGPATRQAVRQFQQAQGLAVTGAVDAATAGAFTAGASGGPTSDGGDVAGRVWSSPARPASVRERNPSSAKGYNQTFNEIVAAAGVPPPPAAAGNYLPFRIIGNQLLLSGQAPFLGSVIKYTGKVGDSVSMTNAQAAARLTGINLLYVAQAALGTLDRVRNVIELEGMVNCTPTFTQPSAVIDACSALMVEVFGSTHGKHVRSAVGQVALAFDITVEIKLSLEVDN
jgi:peptidoglycan hydrolase-like protein with peptidoglycan-binding domain